MAEETYQFTVAELPKKNTPLDVKRLAESWTEASASFKARNIVFPKEFKLDPRKDATQTAQLLVEIRRTLEFVRELQRTGTALEDTLAAGLAQSAKGSKDGRLELNSGLAQLTPSKGPEHVTEGFLRAFSGLTPLQIDTLLNHPSRPRGPVPSAAVQACVKNGLASSILEASRKSFYQLNVTMTARESKKRTRPPAEEEEVVEEEEEVVEE